MIKTYNIRRVQHNYVIATVTEEVNGGIRDTELELRLDLVSHSPDGFEFGYFGSGPAQLAIAILSDYLKDDSLALKLYQDFKNDIIAIITKESFEITEEQLNLWLYGKTLKIRFNKLKERIDNLKCT